MALIGANECANWYNQDDKPPAVPAAVMYRSEDCYGEGYRDPASVLAHELQELGNSDTALYMLEHYLTPGTDLFEQGEKYYRAAESDTARDLDPDEVYRFFAGCLEEVGLKTGKAITFGLWLARKDVVEGFYCQNMGSFTIDSYVTDGGIVLDDLGYDGMFIGFEKERFPIKTEEIERRR